MDTLIELRELFETFLIDDEKINLILENKKLYRKLNHIYLVEKNLDFKSNEFPSSEKLIFISLREELLPTTYLFNIIKENVSKDLIARPSSAKQANNFCFDKNFSFEGILGVRLKQHKHFLVEHENKILGYVTLNKKDKKTPIRNLFNLGEYLKE